MKINDLSINRLVINYVVNSKKYLYNEKLKLVKKWRHCVMCGKRETNKPAARMLDKVIFEIFGGRDKTSV